jgi:hypothetical protein
MIHKIIQDFDMDKSLIIKRTDVIEAINSMNLQKSCGSDLMFPNFLYDFNIQKKLVDYIVITLNKPNPKIPEYAKIGRLVLLSKSTKEFAEISNTRPIAI